MTETKTTSRFRYVEVAQKKPWGFSRNNIMDSKGFTQEFSGNRQTDLYCSYMLFDEEIVEYVNKTGSVSGFPGPAIARHIVVDFDAEQEQGGTVSDEALEQARQDALSYVHGAAEEFGFPPGCFGICFSGCKGFSLELSRKAFGGLVPSSSAHKEVGYLVRALYPGPDLPSTLDFKIYDVNTRLWRVDGTINSKSGLYKTPLTLEELDTLSIAQIKELAAENRKGVERPEVEPVESLIELYERARAEVAESKPSGSSRNGARGNGAKGGAIYIAGERNTRLTRTAGWFRREGHDEQAIFAVLETLNDTVCEEPLDQAEVRSIAHSVAQYDPKSNLPLDEEIEWSDPEPLPTLPPVPPFPFDLLPKAFKEWVKDISERMQVAPDFVAVAAMIVAATIVGRKLGIRPKKEDDWLVVPNLWGFVVGKPASLKSPALEEARTILKKLDEKAEEDFRAAQMEYELQLMLAEAQEEAHKKRKKELVKQVSEAENEEKRKELMKNLEDLWEAGEVPKPEPPTKRRHWTSDATTEKIGELLVENQNGLLAYRDELAGWFSTLTKAGREGDRQFYLEAWNGNNSHQVDRIGRGSFYIPALCLSMLGSIQPGVLSSYVSSASKGGLGADGLLQRFQLAVWPDTPSEYEYVDRKPDAEARARAYDAFKALVKMEGSVDDDDGFIRFSEEAQPIFVEWFTSLNRRLHTEPMVEVFEAHLGKYRSLMPSLALLIELIDTEGEAESVGVEATQKAKGWMEYLEHHARRIYFSGQGGVVLSEELLEHIDKGEVEHGCTIRDIYRKGWSGLSTPEEVGEALAGLENYGWVVVYKKQSKGGGRPSECVLFHPKLRKE